MTKWVSLHHHSTYSFQDGYGQPGEHVARAIDLGYEAMALTEHGNVSSHFRFEQDAIKKGIKPIFGCEAYTGPVDLDNRKRTKYHLILLAMDSAGYTNLNKVVTQSWIDFYQYPTVGGTSLAARADGLICLSGCTGSMLACNLVGGKDIPEPPGGMDMESAMSIAERFRSLFGDRYFLEVQGFPELEKTCRINPAYEIMGKELGIPLVATMDVHYPMPDDNEMQVIIHAADRGGKTVDQQSQGWEYDVRLTLPPDTNAMYKKMRATGLSRAAAIESIESTELISGRCNVTLPKAERLRYRPEQGDMDPWV